MLTRTVVALTGSEGSVRAISGFVGHPVVALLASVLVAMFTFGYSRGTSVRRVGVLLGDGLAPIAAIVLIIGAGGGLKQTLVSIGIGDAIGKAAQNSHLPPLLFAWLVAAAIRVATGSATVATVTASGLMAPVAPALTQVSLPLLALSIGAGSLFLSHVNDAGFWLVKEYFGMSIGETLLSWSLMETIVSVVAMVAILALSAIV
jgi:GntP family gluconate:H+ symporter